VGMTRIGLQHHQVLRAQHVAQEFAREHGELQAVLLLGHLLVAFARLHQPQIANVARERHLRRGNAHVLQLLGKVFLRRDALAANQLQYLALTVAFGHTLISFSRCLAAPSAPATACGPVPPITSRDCIPRRGSSNSGKSMPNARMSSALQSEGFFPARTLSRTKRPTS